MRCLCHNTNRWMLPALLAAALGLFPAARLHAGAYTYSTQQRTINAGILLDDEPGSGADDGNGMGADDPAPYIFYVLNQRSDLKPYGWNIINPLAPRTVTGDIQTRWDARTNNSPAGQNFIAANNGHAYQIGQLISPAMAPYWEVSLAKSTLSDLLQYDILAIRPRDQSYSFTAEDAEKLRRYVDAGGTLWIEDCGRGSANPTGIDPNAPPFFDVQLRDDAGTPGAATLPLVGGIPIRHPIISTPYLLSQADINNLGDKHVGTYYNSNQAKTGPPGNGLLVTVVGNSGAGNLPLISAGQMGAGQIIVTSQDTGDAIDEYVGGINVGFGGNSGPYCGLNLTNAPTQDLKLLSDMIAWSSAHPNERKTSHQTGSSDDTLSSSLKFSWAFPVSGAGGAALPGAVIQGDFGYARDAAGILHAFNNTPGKDIFGTGTFDAGLPDYSLGQPYDEIWRQPIGANGDVNASAPTVGVLPTAAQSVVFVEGADGKVYGYDATSGIALSGGGISGGVLPNSGVTGAAYGGGAVAGPAPAPTLYGSRLYAGQPDGSLYVYDFNEGTGTHYQMGASGAASGEYVIAPPAVGIVTENQNGSDTSDIVAMVATNENVYSVELGARHEHLQPSGGGNTFIIKTVGNVSSARMGIDAAATPAPRAYTTAGNGYPSVLTPTTTSGNTFLVPSGTYATPVFGDYDVDFSNAGAAGNPGTVTRASVSPGAAPATISAPALDRSGNAYYTVTYGGPTLSNGTIQTISSSLFCVRAGSNTAQIKWRFRLPYAGETGNLDADNTSYDALAGYAFVGAPVVDSRGYVYAAASNGSSVAILCFNPLNADGTTGIQATLFSATSTPPGLSNIQYAQPLLANNTPINPLEDEFGNKPPQTIPNTQFTPDNGNAAVVDLNNFGTQGTNVSPDLSEPQAIQIQSYSYTFATANGPNQVTVTPTTPLIVPLHTNLNWYAVLPVSGGVTGGLTKIGQYLYFASGQFVYRVVADPATNGYSILNKMVNPTAGFVSPMDTPNVGIISAVPSGGSGVMLVNGTGGVAAYTNQYTLIVDNNRLIELDSSGNAVWAVDSTSLTTAEGGAIIADNPTSPNAPAQTGLYTTTSLDLNRPTSVTQLSSNDYLVADTGNNRCVRFDRAGKAFWEVSRFRDVYTGANASNPNDPNANGNAVWGAKFNKTAPLLSSGDPDALNQPTSVQTWQTYTTDNSNNPVTVVHYLISDTGNYRVLEVDDVYDNGVPVLPLHNLVWISHTYDKQQRKYRYQSARFYSAPNGLSYIIALVTNAKIAPLAPLATPPTTAPLGTLGPSSADTPGASLVLLDYDPIGLNPTQQANGYIDISPNGGSPASYVLNAVSSFQAYLIGSSFDVNSGESGTPASGQTLSTLPLRNPRFLSTYTPQGQTSNKAVQNFLLADDNGVFDLVPQAAGGFVAQWGFTQADYQAMGTPRQGATLFSRGGIPFLPTSIERIGSKTVPNTGGTPNSLVVGNYLISTAASQGENGFGGEVFDLTINGDAGTRSLQTQALSSPTLGLPNNTSALTQPAFAVRTR